MSLLVVIVALLLAGALGLLYFPWSGKVAVDRDALNRALYQSRLQELAQERGEDNPALVVELQRTLLTDIPPQAQSGERPLRRWALLPGALLLVVLSLGLYLKTSDIGQVLLWQQAERHFPALLQQVKDPTAAPLRMDELAELRLGLRSHLQDTPERPRRLAAAWAAGPVVKRWRDGDRRLWPGACSGGGRPGGRLSITPARWCGREIAVRFGWASCCCVTCISGSRTARRCWRCWP
ncbi:cytochrome c heme lyase subunit CcmH [Klebsiella pneumoniae]|uniref:Cytochrome c heme lyase subunit CcmH n=1 Tax=Klebsiella pneumoniae TaxID=573 RepID=A0A377W059_KLEPN|nr:cytochrome c heme lyase subunit CcmH [Klebsiella pneumoniae]